VVERYKASVIELERKLAQEERMVKEREEAAKKLEGKLSEATY
jgi:CII-binding regulator of phage lambda lysogenization HflD